MYLCTKLKFSRDFNVKLTAVVTTWKLVSSLIWNEEWFFHSHTQPQSLFCTFLELLESLVPNMQCFIAPRHSLMGHECIQREKEKRGSVLPRMSPFYLERKQVCFHEVCHVASTCVWLATMRSSAYKTTQFWINARCILFHIVKLSNSKTDSSNEPKPILIIHLNFELFTFETLEVREQVILQQCTTVSEGWLWKSSSLYLG